jgi:hypothetical protein
MPLLDLISTETAVLPDTTPRLRAVALHQGWLLSQISDEGELFCWWRPGGDPTANGQFDSVIAN